MQREVLNCRAISMIDYNTYTLDNGLKVVHKPSIRNVSFCGFFVNTGTRDEKTNEFGMAHFVEHMLFKGTHKRKSYHIINRMEAVGGELNAYTNKEETVIYSTFLERDVDRAIELLTDIVFHSQCPQNELEKEREVVIDEIHSYEDSPSELIFDDFEDLVFDGGELGHNILGSPESLESFDQTSVLDFIGQHYTTSNVIFFSVGKTPFSKVVRLAQKYMSDIKAKKRVESRQQPRLETAKQIILDKDTSQTHVVIGTHAYDMHDDRRRALLLLNNILGGPGMNSRLNINLREKKGYVYNVESSVTSYTDTGLFSIYFGSDKRNSEKCVSLVFKELKKLRTESLTSIQLDRAKKQFIGQMGIASDNSESVAIGLAKSVFHYNKFDSLEHVFNEINRITSVDILEIANDIFDESKQFILKYD